MIPTLRPTSSVVPGFGSSGTGSCTDTATAQEFLSARNREMGQAGAALWDVGKVKKAAEQPKPVLLPKTTASGAVKQLKCTDQHLGLGSVRNEAGSVQARARGL